MDGHATHPHVFADRKEAGKYLAERLRDHEKERPVIAGLPRGGVVVAREIAEALNADLDVIFAGKLKAPYNPELAIGAVAEDGQVYINRTAVMTLNIKDDYIERQRKERLSVIKERLKTYRAVKKKVPLSGRTVVIVDDGLATGATMISAIHAANAEKARAIIVAVPGGPEDTLSLIREMPEVSEVVCPVVPRFFFAVSQIYSDFTQVEDEEVVEILKGFNRSP
jgi:predicted phosphoribosyltransferase